MCLTIGLEEGSEDSYKWYEIHDAMGLQLYYKFYYLIIHLNSINKFIYKIFIKLFYFYKDNFNN